MGVESGRLCMAHSECLAKRLGATCFAAADERQSLERGQHGPGPNVSTGKQAWERVCVRCKDNGFAVDRSSVRRVPREELLALRHKGGSVGFRGAPPGSDGFRDAPASYAERFKYCLINDSGELSRAEKRTHKGVSQDGALVLLHPDSPLPPPHWVTPSAADYGQPEGSPLKLSVKYKTFVPGSAKRGASAAFSGAAASTATGSINSPRSNQPTAPLRPLPTSSSWAVAFSTDEALDALEAEVARQRQAKPGWRLTSRHEMAAPWEDLKWKAGGWLKDRSGDRDRSKASCAKMTERQRERLDALPYGEISTDEALDALEAEVARQRQAKPGWRLTQRYEMAAPWGNLKWKAGCWLKERTGDRDSSKASRAKMTERQRERLDALPYGGAASVKYKPDEEWEAEVAKVVRGLVAQVAQEVRAKKAEVRRPCSAPHPIACAARPSRPAAPRILHSCLTPLRALSTQARQVAAAEVRRPCSAPHPIACAARPARPAAPPSSRAVDAGAGCDARDGEAGGL